MRNGRRKRPLDNDNLTVLVGGQGDNGQIKEVALKERLLKKNEDDKCTVSYSGLERLTGGSRRTNAQRAAADRLRRLLMRSVGLQHDAERQAEELMSQQGSLVVFQNTASQVAAVVGLAVLLGNVNAVVDAVLHPEIPYLDLEHLVVGGVTACVSVTLSILLLRYFRRLRRAIETIDRLEALLPICASCKKIRRAGADPSAVESWQDIESYITEKTKAIFSHSICPECMARLYPEHAREMEVDRSNESK